jgi:DNA-binding NarL/FixJ family response regulator
MHQKKIDKARTGRPRTIRVRASRAVTPSARMTPATPRSREVGRVRLAIATQPALLRDVLSRLLKLEPDLEVVGHGHDEDRIVEVIKNTAPALLLFDYEALGPNSESIIGRLRRLAPKLRVLVMATRSADENVDRALRAGASGLVGKQLDFESLLRAIRAVAGGEIWANRRAQALTLEHLTDFAGGASEPDRQLTRREQQIVDGVARGLRNKEIARQLDISEKTVKSHLNNIFQKLGLEGRFALARFDQHQGQPKT